MYGFFPPEEAVLTLLLEEARLTFFIRAEEEVVLTLFTAAEGEAAPTVFAPVEGGAASLFAPVAGVGKKKFSSSTSCCPVWTWRLGSWNVNAPAD
jgi:hypothetical protein